MHALHRLAWAWSHHPVLFGTAVLLIVSSIVVLTAILTAPYGDED